MMIKVRAVLIILAGFYLFAAPQALLASSSFKTRLFYQANVLYGEKKYNEAIKDYQDIIKQGYTSGNIYYNLGNSYFKLDNYPRALLYYARAKRIIPRDTDLIFNYRYVLSLANPNYQVLRHNLSIVFLNKTFGSLNINELLIFLTGLNIIIFLLLILRIFFRSFKKYSLYFVFILGIILFTGFYYFLTEAPKIGREAIIVVPTTEAKFSPHKYATTYFTLLGGDKVTIIETNDKWVKIKRSDGRRGWIPEITEEKI